MSELAHDIAGLPSELEAEDEDEEAKRFDLLMLNLQLALLRLEPSFERIRQAKHRLKIHDARSWSGIIQLRWTYLNQSF